ncbi:ATPase [Nostoc sp. CENA543]|uniref:AAA family ATPase n=1 Tax=Nostoc sp. CENA543 TaxID=1869241 RepID=UPI000CA14669|nr:ATP-binding protein [Nostoc sp. CENA543]AUT00566.1 ATPase [Nostoc sp. CENA543]
MLKRIYIDNFRCLVNFEINFDSINLLLGGNGSGKSTVFEALRRLQLFIVGGYQIEGLFNFFECTRWQKLPIQRFELEIVGNHGTYKYELAIAYTQNKPHIHYERLWFDQHPLIKYDAGEVEIFNDDYLPSPKYPFNFSQSVLSLLQPSQENTKTTWFKYRIERLVIVQITPTLMNGSSKQEERILNYKMENFVSWYRYISQDQGKSYEIINILQNVLEGFLSFRFEQFSEQDRALKLKFKSSYDTEKPLEYYFWELSDGQKVLLALYTLIYGTQSEDYTLCIDEPENFLALPEIQPWLTQLYDFCSEQKMQALLISHHPELMNYLLVSPIGYWFERQSNAPVRVRKISNENAENTGLQISELIARGWLHESA